MYRDGLQHLSSKHGEGREHTKFHHTRNFISLIREDANEWRCKISQIRQGKSRGNVTKQQINDSVSHAHKLKTRISIIKPSTTKHIRKARLRANVVSCHKTTRISFTKWIYSMDCQNTSKNWQLCWAHTERWGRNAIKEIKQYYVVFIAVISYSKFMGYNLYCYLR